MAFLDNSGDILLDAVLTDTGRFRMARGDFRISKFALADDEIDYSLYNKNHPSGSAYYDLEVLRTPLLEAFTNNTSTMKSKLISITRTNILHMPVLKLQNGGSTRSERSDLVKGSKLHSSTAVSNTYIVTSDSDTTQLITEDDGGSGSSPLRENGIIVGVPGTTQYQNVNDQPNQIVVEHGIDTTEIAGILCYLRTCKKLNSLCRWIIGWGICVLQTVQRQMFLLLTTIR